jgi:20S proteasome subunit alpha 7
VYYGYRACAVGKGKALAKTELEKIVSKDGGAEFEGMGVREGVMEVARM